MPSSFDVNWFNSAKLELRTKEVEIPKELEGALRKKGDAVWVVRQLEDSDIVRADDETDKMGLVPKIIEAAVSSKDSTKLDAVKEILGIQEDTPQGTRKKAHYISCASIDPEIDRAGAAKLLRGFPVFANKLVNEILALTGMGAELGKQPRSTETRKSEPS